MSDKKTIFWRDGDDYRLPIPENAEVTFVTSDGSGVCVRLDTDANGEVIIKMRAKTKGKLIDVGKGLDNCEVMVREW